MTTVELEAEEGPTGVSRVEAFSDGVIAIIVTIMVLELHAPVAEGLDKLWALWPVFLAYVLSYAFVAIYWVNHHRLFTCATRVSNALLWSNMLLLFALSLIPFTTSYLGEHHFSREATWLYLASTLFPALSYSWLQEVIKRTGRQTDRIAVYYRQSTRKGIAAIVIYATGAALTGISPWMGIACAVLVAILWFLPQSAVNELFGR
ncbi:MULTISPECIES: TMEM175 family protein [Sphingomonas]|uniref:TMEM175 family protein n=1 Tax=Sphingomonas TaxID=13687 RepID=UPI00083464DB|nr:TMEM175 family protein [Sphingomonas sp. CCH10-B3]